jgi:hypothetical protein
MSIMNCENWDLWFSVMLVSMLFNGTVKLQTLCCIKQDDCQGFSLSQHNDGV